ncbi:MAG: hypothetical protein PVI30_17885 [Myxococcales bacterium]
MIRWLVLLAPILGLLGCSGAPESRAADELRTDAPSAAKASRTAVSKIPEPPPNAPLEKLLEYKAQVLAPGLIADDPPIVGELPEGGRQDYLTILKGGFCYRILGVGGPDVEDMDLFLYDPNGVQTHQDPAQDRFPLLGTQADICPLEAGKYRVQVHMYEGGGRYALRTYRTPM